MEAIKFEVKLKKGQDNCIFIKEDIFCKNWEILRTRVSSSCASVMFVVEAEYQAVQAGWGIANAINGKFFGKIDPRKS